MHATVVALVAWAWSLAAAPAPAEVLTGEKWVRCVVPAGPAVAIATLPDGTHAVAREGALELHGPSGIRVVTPCEGLPEAFPTALAVADGRLAVGFRARGVQWWDGGRFEPVDGLPEGVAVRALAADGPRLLVGTSEHGLWHADPGARATRSTHPVLRQREITALTVRDGTIEVGAGARGWWRVLPTGSVRRVDRETFAGCFRDASGEVEALAPGPACRSAAAPLGRDSGLPSGHVTAMAVHRGALYVGSFDGGLARLVGDRFEPTGGPRFVNVLLSDADRLWIGTAQGLFVLEADGRITEPALGLPGAHVNSLARGADGTLWIATGHGLAGVRGGRVRVFDERAGLPTRIVHSVAAGPGGVVWAGTAGGVARIDAGGVRVFSQASGDLPHDWANALLTDGDGVLVGTYDAGVARLGAERGEASPGLAGKWVNPNGLFRVGDALVVATLGDGLLVVRGDRVVEHRAGLPSDDVTAVAVHGGAVWIGTRGGLTRWSAAPDDT